MAEKQPAGVPEIRIRHPDWVLRRVDFDGIHEADEERMRFTIALARENVERESGGPFAAAIFEAGSGRLVSVGVNRVVACDNAMLHGEVIAFMTAQARVGSHTLRADGLPAHELFTSCEPCAMCLGAALWSGVSRVVSAATREDASAAGFEEGPVFPASWDYLRARGITFTSGLLRAEARAVFALYRSRGGTVYNG